MASRNLLNAKDAIWADLFGNGKSFEVPHFQRDYSWTQEQWEDLWLDIQALRQDEAEIHYMGTLVVSETSPRRYRIIDGQQRFATLSLLALAIVDALQQLAGNGVEPEANSERARSLRSTFLSHREPVSLTEISKLSLNLVDDPFFQDNLLQLRPPQNPRALPTSCRLLWQCFQYFQRQIANDATLSRDGAALASLLSNTISLRLLFIQISVEDELNAYVVFETLNARGLELSATDLLKNYLFSRIQFPQDLAALERRWRKLVEAVRQDRFPEFLRYHLLCQQTSVRQQRLFKLVRDQVRQPAEVFSLIAALEERAELFSALLDPNHEFWLDLPAAKPYIRDLQLFGVRQMMPLLFAGRERLDNERFVSLLRQISIISFRHTVIGARNTNELEPAYSQAAHQILTGALSTPAQVFDALRGLYVPDDQFRNDFAKATRSTNGRNKRIVKYILCRLEAQRRGTPVHDETDPASIEHILPENPDASWEDSFPPRYWPQSLYRLGNLTLLEAPANRSIGNATYPAKQAAYQTSSYRITNEIPAAHPEEWTLERLEARQQQMAQLACQIWRLDY